MCKEKLCLVVSYAYCAPKETLLCKAEWPAAISGYIEQRFESVHGNVVIVFVVVSYES